MHQDPRETVGDMSVVPDTGSLLDALEAFLSRFIVIGKTEMTAICLWIAHTWAFKAAETTPYLAIFSADKACGKSRLMECMEKLVRDPWTTGYVTPSSLYRATQDGQTPTLLLDEADAALGTDRQYDERTRGILNSGFRIGGKVSMSKESGSSGYTKIDCSTFFPKAVAGIGNPLHDTTASRSIPIELHRKLPHEKVEKFRHKLVTPLTEPLREQLAVWAETWTAKLADAMPDLPSQLGDRAGDIWEPLLAIADVAGAGWAGRARESAVLLSSSSDERESLGELLLRDIFLVFDGEKMSSEALVQALARIEDSPWGGRSSEWYGDFDPRVLAKLLKPFKIGPTTIRVGLKTPSGYWRSQFEGAWSRYLPGDDPNNLNKPNGDVENVDDVDLAEAGAYPF